MIIRDASKDFVERVIKDPEMFARISHDKQRIEDLNIEDVINSARWLECVTESMDKVGVFAVRPCSVATLDIHIHILEEYRKKHAQECVLAFYDWMLANMPDNINKLTAKIPVCFPDVYYFALKCGWADEGVDRKSCPKAGGYIDRHAVGITREEMRLCLQYKT